MIQDSRFKNSTIHTKGAAMLVATMFFLAISLTVVLGLSIPIVKQLRVTSNTLHSRDSFFIADTLLEDIIYRFREGMDVDATETLTISGNTAMASIVDILGGAEKEIESEGSVRNLVRIVRGRVIVGTGASFNYGLQAGNGGIILRNSSTVTGNVYANGPVDGSGTNVLNGNLITGSVVSATTTGIIDGIKTTDDAYARTITTSNIAGDAYYNTISGSLVLGSSNSGQQDQPSLDLPITDEILDGWEEDAEAGGVISSPCPYVISTSMSIGPVKINCDLEINGPGITVTLEGAVWVSGNITFGVSPLIVIDPSLGGTVVPIIADKQSDRTNSSKITLNQGSTFTGSGVQGSFIFLTSRNNSAENGGSVKAINARQTSGGDLILYSNHGEINLEQSVSLREVTAWRIRLNNSANVIYDTGLANLLFSSGPGGTYTREDWREIE